MTTIEQLLKRSKCSCLTKTPEIGYHLADCSYRLSVEKIKLEAENIALSAFINKMGMTGTDLRINEIVESTKKIEELLAKVVKWTPMMERTRCLLADFEKADVKLKFLEEKGISADYMKTSDKPEPYLVYIIREDSELCDKKLLRRLFDAEMLLKT